MCLGLFERDSLHLYASSYIDLHVLRRRCKTFARSWENLMFARVHCRVEQQCRAWNAGDIASKPSQEFHCMFLHVLFRSLSLFSNSKTSCNELRIRIINKMLRCTVRKELGSLTYGTFAQEVAWQGHRMLAGKCHHAGRCLCFGHEWLPAV